MRRKLRIAICMLMSIMLVITSGNYVNAAGEDATTYTVTLNAGTGYFSGNSEKKTITESVSKGEKLDLGSYINSEYHTTSDGKLISWWYSDSKLSQKISIDDYGYYTPSKDVTLYAKWEKGCKVTFDYGIAKDVCTGSEYIQSVYCLKGHTLNDYAYLDGKTVDGYIFDGWYTDKQFKNQITYLSSYVVESDVTIYANWIKAVKITYDAQNGQFSDKTTKKTVQIPAGEIIKTGYAAYSKDTSKALTGWALSKGGTLIDDNTSIAADNDTTLYAIYGNGCKVTFDANGSTIDYYWENAIGSGTNSVEVNKDKLTLTFPIGSTLNNYKFYQGSDIYKTAPEGKRFAGWSTSKSANDIIDLDNYKLSNKTLTLYAIWSSPYKVTFDANGGHYYDGTTTVEEVIPGSSIKSDPRPETDEKKVFDSWNTKTNGTGEKIEDAYDYVPKGDMTLYAQWTDAYQVIFDANGGYMGDLNYDRSIRKTKVGGYVYYYGSKPLNKNTSLAFAGWSTDKQGKNIVAGLHEDYIPKADITLYAAWTKSCKVKYHANNAEKSSKGPIGAYFRYNGTNKTDFEITAATGTTLTYTDDDHYPWETNNVEGWNFTGYNTKADGSGQSIKLDTYKLTGDIDLYAQWNGSGTGDTETGNEIIKYIDDAINTLEQQKKAGDITGMKKTIDDALSELGSLAELREKAATDEDVAKKLSELEDAYVKNAGINVVDPASDNETVKNIKDIFGSDTNAKDVSVSGLGLNTDPNSRVRLGIEKTPDSTKKKIEGDYKQVGEQFDMEPISGNKNGSAEKIIKNLIAPIAITLPLPKNIIREKFYVLHFYSDGTSELIKPVFKGNCMTITVTRFSTFAFVELADELQENNNGNKDDANKSDNGNGQQNNDNSNQNNKEVKVGTKIKTKTGTFAVIGEETVAFYAANKEAKKVKIPAKVSYEGRNFKTTAISAKAFKNCKKLTGVTIPAGIKKIGSSAFEGCVKLTNVSISASVTEIGKNAFKGCKKLSKITIPKGVTKIGASAFMNCSSLKSVTIKTKKLKAVGKNALKGIKKDATIKVPKNMKTKYKKTFSKAKLPSKVKIK